MTTFDAVYLSAVGLRRLLHPATASLSQQQAHYRIAVRLMRHVAGAVTALVDDECYAALCTGAAVVCARHLPHADVLRRVDALDEDLRRLGLAVRIEARTSGGLTRLSTETWNELAKSPRRKRDPSDYVPSAASDFARLAQGDASPPLVHLAAWRREVDALGPALLDRGRDRPTDRALCYLRGDVQGQGRALTHDAPDLATFRERSEAVTAFFDLTVPRIAAATLGSTGLLLHSVSDDIVAVGSPDTLDELAREVTAAFATLGLGRFTFAMTPIAPSEPLAAAAERAAALLVRARNEP